MSEERIIDLSHLHRKFETVYDQIEHVEEIARLRFLSREKVGMAERLKGSKTLFRLLPSYDRLLFSLHRSYGHEMTFSLIRDFHLSLDDLRRRGFRIDMRLLHSALPELRYDYDKRHSTVAFRGCSYARLELNRDLNHQRVVALSRATFRDPLVFFMPATTVLLSDTRTGMLRVAKFRDIDLDKGHLLASTYLSMEKDLGLESSKGTIFPKRLENIPNLNEDLKFKLEMEADFYRRWRLYLDKQDDKLEHHLMKVQEKNVHKKEKRVEQERDLSHEIALKRELALDFVQERISQPTPQELEIDQDLGLHLGEDF